MTDQERKSKVEKSLEKASPTVKAKILKDFDRISFKEDSEFETYLAETQAYVDFKEENKGPEKSKSSVINADGPVDLSKVSSGVKSFLDSKKPDYQDPLGGKTGSENPYSV